MNEFSHKKVVELAIKDMFDKGDFNKITDHSVLPDKDENQNGFVCHFYNPVTNSNYQDSEDSAKSRCIAHLGKYLMTKNLGELGRSIHFLEDICTPVHTQYEDATDAIIRGALHLEFEKDLDEFFKNYSLKYDYKFPEFQSLSEVLDFCALNAARKYYLYKDKCEKLYTTLEQTIKLAIWGIRYLATNYALNDRKSVNLIQNNKSKNVGLVIQGVNDSRSKNVFDLATFVPNYRLRMPQDGQIFVFKKPHLGANFIFNNSVQID